MSPEYRIWMMGTIVSGRPQLRHIITASIFSLISLILQVNLKLFLSDDTILVLAPNQVVISESIEAEHLSIKYGLTFLGY